MCVEVLFILREFAVGRIATFRRLA
jgi:hypothetical protein